MALKSSMRILIVDETQSMRKIIKKMLEQLGFKKSDEADGGSDAWEKIQQAGTDNSPYEFIISDWALSDMTGLDLLKNIRTSEVFKNTPFLMVTAEAEQGNVVVAVKAGVNNFIVKPFSAETLKEKIIKIFKQ